MGCTMPGIPALHHLLKFAHMCVHQVSDAINHLILCVHLLCMPSIFPSIRVFSNQSALRIRWPKYWSFSIRQFSLVQSLSYVQLCNPMDCSTLGLPVHHQLLEFTQTHVSRVGEAIQPSHPLPSPSPPAFNLAQHQDLFQGVSSSDQVAKVLEFQL